MIDVLLQVALVIVSLACVVLCSWRRKRHGYSSIPDEENVSEKLARDREFQRLAVKEALCQFFLNLSGKYTFVEQLDDIGCRLGRSWFIVKEYKSDKKLLVLTKKSSECPLSLTATNIQLVRDLFEPLSKHPYIFPITDIDVLAHKPFVFVVETFQKNGTLKDLIYKKKPREEWSGKYRVQGKGINVFEIKTYGRQILEAMVFLHDKGIPTNGHIHSGNVFVKKGVCRISGYEQAILGFKSRLYPRLSKLLKKNKYAIDTLCFGHLMYEMAYGQELFDAKPGKLHYEFCSRSAEVGEILKFIFGADDSPWPDIQDILNHRFFQGGEGLYLIDPDSIFFKPQVTRNILKSFKKYFKKWRRKSRKDQEEEEESPKLPEKSHWESKLTDEQRTFTVSYDAEAEKVTATLTNNKTSSPDVSSSPQRSSSPVFTSDKSETRAERHKKQAEAPKFESGSDEKVQRPTFGVDALMNSIKQAIEKRHEAMEDSDEKSSRASSFSSSSPPGSPTFPAKSSTTKPPLPQTPPLSQKPSLSQKPTISQKGTKQGQDKSGSRAPVIPPASKGPPPPPATKSKVEFIPAKSGQDRSALLKSIENGSKLRKTVTNDRSAPRV